jgi:hypothetical protein
VCSGQNSAQVFHFFSFSVSLVEREKLKNFGFPPAVQVQKLIEKGRAALAVRLPTVNEALSATQGAAVRAD